MHARTRVKVHLPKKLHTIARRVCDTGAQRRLLTLRGLLELATALLSKVSSGHGWVAEWSKAVVLKTTVRESVPWVRIPAHPLLFVSHWLALARIGSHWLGLTRFRSDTYRFYPRFGDRDDKGRRQNGTWWDMPRIQRRVCARVCTPSLNLDFWHGQRFDRILPIALRRMVVTSQRFRR